MHPPAAAAIRPLAKAAACKPTLLIGGRHHANEVSSTPAQLALISELATRPDLTRSVLVVAVPLENVEGAAIHHAMQAEHPTWKLHAARFNAAGVEFRKHYTRPESPFTEARVLPHLWQQLLPDVFLDDHGVPSHEWLQTFAGYNPPPYFPPSYRLPNALIYGIFDDPDPERHPAAVAACRALERFVAAQVDADPEISRGNALLRERYAHWGNPFVPERFPLELQGGMISYRRQRKGWLAERVEITPVSLVTEVPDETAQGDHLALCRHAHLVADRATVTFLAALPQPVAQRVSTEGGRTVRAWERPRPLRLPAPAAEGSG